MKALVAVNCVVDFNVKVRVKSDGSGLITANVYGLEADLFAAVPELTELLG